MLSILVFRHCRRSLNGFKRREFDVVKLACELLDLAQVDRHLPGDAFDRPYGENLSLWQPC
jgi:hypothetical protein